MQIGIDSFAAQILNPETLERQSASDRMHDLIEEIVHADKVGLDNFGLGEHHREEFLDSAPAMILAAAAARTKNIRLTSAVTVLSADDPVRVFQRFATLDLISNGRAEIVAGRGSFTEAFPLFGLELQHYDELFAENLELLLELRKTNPITWVSKHRAPLSGQGVYPRPVQNPLPVWLGVGGTPESFARAGSLGLPLMIAIIGGDFRRFRPHVNLYRKAGAQAGFTPEQLKVGVHAFGYVSESSEKARDIFYPGSAHMMNQIGKERGWPPMGRRQFDAASSPEGPYLIGDSKAVAEKILYVDEVLGGVDRISLQMTNVMVNHEQMIEGISYLGNEVAPIVRKHKAIA